MSEPMSQPETPDQRSQRLARIFGDVLPETTSDERDPVDPSTAEGGSEAWLKAQVPPHHG